MSVQEEGTKVPSDLEKVTIPESQTQSDSKDEALLVQTSTGVNGAASTNDDPFMYSPPDVAAPLKDQEPIIDSHLSELLFTSGPFASTLSSDSIISSSNRLKNLAVRLVIVRTNRSLIKSVNEILSRDGADGVDRIKLEAFTKDLMEDMKDGKLDESKRKAADLVEGSVWKSLDEVIGGLWEETVKIEVGEVQFLIGSWVSSPLSLSLLQRPT